MDKKRYLTIGITITIFVVIIIAILLSGNKGKWTTEILKADSYTITMKDCNNREVTLPNNSVEDILKKIEKTSDNGPWTGNTAKCYPAITISYDIGGIVQQREIKLIDDSSIAVNLNDGDRYYVNAEEVIKYANNLFSTY